MKLNYSKIKKYFFIIMLGFVVFNIFSNIYANSDFWGSATNWFNKLHLHGDEDATNQAMEIVKTFDDMINVIGTSVITLVTVFLGIKYIYGSVDSKADVKESLINLLVACVFFFGWYGIKNLLFPYNNDKKMYEFVFLSSEDKSYESMVGRLYDTGTYIAYALLVIGVIYVGVRYIFAGAMDKADIKAKSGTFIIGIILSCATVNFLTFISTIINETL